MHEFTYITAFMVGLLGGVHCVGMCGGIISALSFAGENKKNTANRSALTLLLGYNAGRILSYTIMGGLMGGVGWLVNFWSNIHALQMILQFIAALFMLSLGLYISGWWTGLSRVEKTGAKLWQWIQPMAKKLLPVKTPSQALSLGLLWGWLPCGLVYSVLVWSVSTASFQQGALLMLSFGLGTLPNLMAMGVFADRLKQLTQNKKIRQFAGSVVIFFALWHLYLLFRVL